MSYRYGPSHVYETPDGTVVHEQQAGYYSTEYQIVGTLEGVDATVATLKRRYPPGWYCGRWPAPFEVHPGLWMATPEHSNSCD